MGYTTHSEHEVFNNYLCVVPNSHFWTDLNDLVNCIELTKVTKEYLITGLQNTINRGYEISLVGEYKEKTLTYASVNEIIDFINSNEYIDRILFLTLNYTIAAGYNLKKLNDD